MTLGMFLLPIALMVSAIVQLFVDKTMPDLPDATTSFVSAMNTFDNCSLNVTLIKASYVQSTLISSNSVAFVLAIFNE